MHEASPWWAPHVYADRRDFLKARGRIAIACRAFFQAEGFEEVETACLQVSPGAETHLAAFRNGERSALHHPEFTMLEWYRAGAPYAAIMADCVALARAAAEAAGSRLLNWRGQTADLFAEPEILTVAEAFARFAGFDLLAALDDRAALADAARRLSIRVAADDDWSDLLSKILNVRIEPELGRGRLTLLTEYPAREAALARLKPGDLRVSERFEMYACGVELANGFGELVDPIEQRARFEASMAEKKRRYGEAFPIDEDFLRALEIMPEASGVALGFDRLVMLAAGAERIEQVLWTPVAARGV